jgi:RNA polymerase sigma-70 factor, ECF subfamily
MAMTLSDETLAKAAATGDRAAFATLLERHYDRLHALCWRLTGHQSDAQDLAQDICASLPAKLAGWRGDARFTTWLYRVAVNAAHDQRRRQAVRNKAALGWGDWEVSRQADIAEAAAAKDWLAAAMATLSEDLRDTLALTMDADLTQAEAAAVLGLSEGTIAWRIAEVKKRLRALATQEAIQ